MVVLIIRNFGTPFKELCINVCIEIHAYLNVCVFEYMHIGIYVYWDMCVLEYMPIGIHAYWNICLLEYMCIWILAQSHETQGAHFVLYNVHIDVYTHI